MYNSPLCSVNMLDPNRASFNTLGFDERDERIDAPVLNVVPTRVRSLTCWAPMSTTTATLGLQIQHSLSYSLIKINASPSYFQIIICRRINWFLFALVFLKHRQWRRRPSKFFFFNTFHFTNFLFFFLTQFFLFFFLLLHSNPKISLHNIHLMI